MRKSQWIILLICTLLLGWFLSTNWTLLPQLVTAVGQGQRGWLGAALVGQLAGLGFLTAIYHAAFRVAGAGQSFRQLLPQSLAAIFVDTTAPVGGAASAAVFIDHAHRQRRSPARTAAGLLLFFVANYAVYLVLLAVALLILAWQGLLTTAIMSMALFLVAIISGLVVLLWMGARHEGGLRRLLAGVRRVVNGAGRLFGRTQLLDEQWVGRQSAEFVTAANTMTQQPRRLTHVMGASLLMHLSMIVVLAAVFLAFQQPFTIPMLLIGYTMHVLFSNVSPTPNGVGIVEIALPPILGSLGVAAATGVGITLVFRALTFWLPLVMGFVATRFLRVGV